MPLLALSGCAAAAKAPTVAPPPYPCPRTVLALRPFEAAETATPGTQSVVGYAIDASSRMRLADVVVDKLRAAQRARRRWLWEVGVEEAHREQPSPTLGRRRS